MEDACPASGRNGLAVVISFGRLAVEGVVRLARKQASQSVYPLEGRSVSTSAPARGRQPRHPGQETQLTTPLLETLFSRTRVTRRAGYSRTSYAKHSFFDSPNRDISMFAGRIPRQSVGKSTRETKTLHQIACHSAAPADHDLFFASFNSATIMENILYRSL